MSNIKDLEIIDVEPFVNEIREVSGVTISWSANIGWGEYTLYKQNGKWYADTECMDKDDDKSFGEMLLKEFFKLVKVAR